jgi:hypothetical protein
MSRGDVDLLGVMHDCQAGLTSNAVQFSCNMRSCYSSDEVNTSTGTHLNLSSWSGVI